MQRHGPSMMVLEMTHRLPHPVLHQNVVEREVQFAGTDGGVVRVHRDGQRQRHLGISVGHEVRVDVIGVQRRARENIGRVDAGVGGRAVTVSRASITNGKHRGRVCPPRERRLDRSLPAQDDGTVRQGLGQGKRAGNATVCEIVVRDVPLLETPDRSVKSPGQPVLLPPEQVVSCGTHSVPFPFVSRPIAESGVWLGSARCRTPSLPAIRGCSPLG